MLVLGRPGLSQTAKQYHLCAQEKALPVCHYLFSTINLAYEFQFSVTLSTKFWLVEVEGNLVENTLKT